MYYEAIVYGYVNIENGMRYVGYHKTKEEYDRYIFSSDNYPLNKAWSHGLLRKSTIFRGTVEDCVTLEHYILSKYNAVGNKEWYNQSNGGAAKLYSFDKLPAKAIKASDDWYTNQINSVYNTVLYADHDLTETIVKRVKSGYYEVIDEPVAKIYHLPKNQVRFEEYDHQHFENIRNSMIDDPADARTRVKPIVVCVMKNGEMLILDGNHTIRAAYAASWTDIPVVYINSSEFNDSQANYDDFGYEMNDRKDHTKGNSKDDCKRAILKLQETAKMDLDAPEFRDICFHNLRQWSKQTIAGNITSLMKIAEEQELIRKYNFKKWSKGEIKHEMSKLTSEIYNGYSSISINSGSSYNAGVGAILNKLTEDDNNRGLIVVSYNNVSEWNDRVKDELHLNRVLLKIHPDLIVKVHYLPAFVDTRTNEIKIAA
jgi:hypothetical protein